MRALPPLRPGAWTRRRLRAAAFAGLAPVVWIVLLHQTVVALLPRLEPPRSVWYAFDGGTEADHVAGTLRCWAWEHLSTEPLGLLDGRYEVDAARVRDFSPSKNRDGSLSVVPTRPRDGFERLSAWLRLDRAGVWTYRPTGANTSEGWREFRRAE